MNANLILGVGVLGLAGLAAAVWVLVLTGRRVAPWRQRDLVEGAAPHRHDARLDRWPRVVAVQRTGDEAHRRNPAEVAGTANAQARVVDAPAYRARLAGVDELQLEDDFAGFAEYGGEVRR